MSDTQREGSEPTRTWEEGVYDALSAMQEAMGEGSLYGQEITGKVLTALGLGDPYEGRTQAWAVPLAELTLDTPVQIWWIAESQEEADLWTKGLNALGVTEIHYQKPGQPGRNYVEGDYTFWTTIRGALEGGMGVDSLVDGYLPEGSEERIRSLAAEAGVENLKLWATLSPRPLEG